MLVLPMSPRAPSGELWEFDVGIGGCLAVAYDFEGKNDSVVVRIH